MIFYIYAMTIEIAILSSAVLLTALVVWLAQRVFYKSKISVLNERLQQQLQFAGQLQEEHASVQLQRETLLKETAGLQSRLQFLNEQFTASKRYQKENEILASQLSMFKVKFQAAEEKLEHQKKEMEQLGERFKFEFSNLAQSIFEEKTQKFTQVNAEKLNAILSPLKSQLFDFKQKVKEAYDKDAIEIAYKAGALYDKFVNFLENMEAIGKKLFEATSAYDHACKQLSAGEGNIINRMEELKRMAADVQQQQPGRLLLEAEEG